MDTLKHKLLKEVYSVIDSTKLGTRNFKKVRRSFLKRLVKDTLDLKLDLKSFNLFTNDHLDKLVAYWSELGNSVSTIINKRAIIVWFLSELKKTDVVLKTSEELGLKKIKKPKDFVYISEDIRNKVYHPITLTILDFQLYFGLTKNEAIKINLVDAYNQRELEISSSLAFNSKERSIRIMTNKQKQTIQDRLTLLGDKSTLLELMPYERVIDLYHSELVYNNIPTKADLRKFYIQSNFIKYQNKGLSKTEIYKELMDKTGFKDKNNLIKVAFS